MDFRRDLFLLHTCRIPEEDVLRLRTERNRIEVAEEAEAELKVRIGMKESTIEVLKRSQKKVRKKEKIRVEKELAIKMKKWGQVILEQLTKKEKKKKKMIKKTNPKIELKKKPETKKTERNTEKKIGRKDTGRRIEKKIRKKREQKKETRKKTKKETRTKKEVEIGGTKTEKKTKKKTGRREKTETRIKKDQRTKAVNLKIEVVKIVNIVVVIEIMRKKVTEEETSKKIGEKKTRKGEQRKLIVMQVHARILHLEREQEVNLRRLPHKIKDPGTMVLVIVVLVVKVEVVVSLRLGNLMIPPILVNGLLFLIIKGPLQPKVVPKAEPAVVVLQICERKLDREIETLVYELTTSTSLNGK